MSKTSFVGKSQTPRNRRWDHWGYLSQKHTVWRGNYLNLARGFFLNFCTFLNVLTKIKWGPFLGLASIFPHFLQFWTLLFRIFAWKKGGTAIWPLPFAPSGLLGHRLWRQPAQPPLVWAGHHNHVRISTCYLGSWSQYDHLICSSWFGYHRHGGIVGSWFLDHYRYDQLVRTMRLILKFCGTWWKLSSNFEVHDDNHGQILRYMMTRCTVVDPHKAGGWVVAGYIKHRQLPLLEVACFF